MQAPASVAMPATSGASAVPGNVPAAANAPAPAAMPARMPVGRRTPRGTRRWYLVHAPQREQATCDKVRKVIPRDLLEDAFVLRKERWRKLDGRWERYPMQMYRDYFFVVTSDVNELDKALSKLSFPVRIAKGDGSFFMPMAADAQAWYERMMDANHVIRSSTGVIVDGVLHVQDGPLVGQEERVTKVDRHHRSCFVRVADDADGGFAECVSIEIPFKS